MIIIKQRELIVCQLNSFYELCWLMEQWAHNSNHSALVRGSNQFKENHREKLSPLDQGLSRRRPDVKIVLDRYDQGVTKRCRLSWLTNSALVDGPKCGGRGGVAGSHSQPMSAAVPRSPNKLWRSNSIFNLWIWLAKDSKRTKWGKVQERYSL